MPTFPPSDSLSHQLEPPHANGHIHGRKKGRKWIGKRREKMEEEIFT
jgi:hypothetical protein